MGPFLWQLAEELRGRVREATGGLTCSAGVGANRLLAKVCGALRLVFTPHLTPCTLIARSCGAASRQAIMELLLGASFGSRRAFLPPVAVPHPCRHCSLSAPSCGGSEWRLAVRRNGECVVLDAAQVCSDLNKPNGQYVLPNDRDVIINFMATLPIRKVRRVTVIGLR